MSDDASYSRRVFHVYQLNQYVKSVLENDILLSNIFIEGEISNFKLHTSGHMYFTLKDEYAAISCVMFRIYAAGLRFMPENGMRIVACGRVSLYEKTGQYQFYAEDIEPWGKGGLYLAFEQMKAKLEREGLFNLSHKRPIPSHPATVAVVTSPVGAAVRDIMNIAARRNNNVRLVIAPALVQGEAAAASIVSAITLVNEARADVLILARGGGSLEDLWPFNEESVARAVYNSKIPVVSAVGHETDYCITDFVADLRAPTPSAAAELCIPELNVISSTLERLDRRAEHAMYTKLDNAGAALKILARRASPKAFLEAVYSRQIYLEQLFGKITGDMEHKTELSRLRLSKLMNGIELLSPVEVLKRGYSLVYGDDGLKTSAGQLIPGECISLRFHDGEVKAVTAEYNIAKGE